MIHARLGAGALIFLKRAGDDDRGDDEEGDSEETHFVLFVWGWEISDFLIVFVDLLAEV
jgi:hypothetical protein